MRFLDDMDNKENKSASLIFDKLGDAFKYGMACELPKAFEVKSNDELKHFNASIAFMGVNNLLSKELILEVYKIVHTHLDVGKSVPKTVGAISTAIFDELLKQYRFKNLGELLEILNSKIIPPWYFLKGKELLEKCGQGAFEHEGYLYYIAENQGQEAFSKIGVNTIIDNTDLDSFRRIRNIGYGYERICGFDSNLKRVYLIKKNQPSFYYVYDMLSDTFKVIKGKLLTINEGIPFSINQDGYVVYMLGDEEHKVRQILPNEKYVVRDKYFFVRPNRIEKGCFYPYCVSFDGKVFPADIEDCRKIIWSEIQILADCDDLNDNYYCDKKALSIISIVDYFRENNTGNKMYGDKPVLLFNEILAILQGYVSENEDITQLLYVLYDANIRLHSNGENFPSEKLYWRIKEIQTSESNNETFKELLSTKDYKGLNELLSEKGTDDKVDESPLLGTIFLTDDGIDIKVVEMSEGVTIGSTIIPPLDMSHTDGLISYDSVCDCFFVTCGYHLTYSERMKIKKRLNLTNENVIYHLQNICIPASVGEETLEDLDDMLLDDEFDIEMSDILDFYFPDGMK